MRRSQRRKGGKDVEFEKIYEMYFRDVYRYILGISGDSHTAEEITEETFWKALKAIDSFDGKKDIRAWLFTIAKNLYLNLLREKSHFSDGEMPEETGGDMVTELENKESAYELHRIIHALEEPYKEVFSLRIFGELSFGQIGGLFGKSAGWARVIFYRAKQRIIEDRERAEKNERS